MGGFNFSMSFSPQSMKEIAGLYGFSIILAPEFQAAMLEGAQQIANKAKANTWDVFANPNGDLADSIEVIPDSPYEIQIGVGVPYGRRRELGFSGCTDSLGRYYANDPAKPYLSTAMTSELQDVSMLLDAGAEAALSRLGG